MSADIGAIAVATSVPFKSKVLKHMMVDVLWLDKKANNQSNGGYSLSVFEPITDEMRERIRFGKKSDRYATVHIDSLAHFFMLASRGLKQWPGENL